MDIEIYTVYALYKLACYFNMQIKLDGGRVKVSHCGGTGPTGFNTN